MSGSTPIEFTCPISMDIMTDPVIVQCGHTFDKESLENWLRSNSVCPTCRVNVNRNEISTNFSLKSMIENSLQNGGSYRPSSSFSNVSGSAEAEKADKTVEPRLVTIDDLNSIEGSYYQDNNTGLIQITLKSPEVEKRNAMSFVCVIDVSGSMGSIVGAGEGGKAFTRLDLVKHVLNVLIVSLTEHDTLSLITYSNDTKVLSNPLNMTKKNKMFLKDRIKALQTENSTYTGEAIKKAYEMIKKSPENSMRSIILLTDGQDTEGYSILERKFEKVDKDPLVQFNTFGFSNDLWSDLLEKLALKGGGIFGFIPDQSMIGTIFINFIANTFELFAQNLFIEIDEKNYEFIQKTELKRIALKNGNTRNFMIRKKESSDEDSPPKISIGFNKKQMMQVPLVKEQESNQFKSQHARYIMLDLISNNVLEPHEIKAFEKQLAGIQDYANELSPGRDNDQKNDQINLSYKNWGTWGAHYVRSFRFAHLNEQCLNFKAPSMKTYRNDKFDDIVDNLTDLFCTLPPPKPTGIVFSHSVNAPTINMNNLMDADAGCILGTCMVKLRNDEMKEIMNLTKGDVLEDGSKVKCVLTTKFSGEMVKIGNLVITPYHPIIFDGEWQFPIDVLIENSQKKLDNPYMVMVNAPKPNWVCQLILDKNHIINAEGIKCIGLGHGFKQGVLKHDYYGTEKILRNLSMFEGWQKGKVSLKSYRLLRDSNGMVNGMDRPVYASPSPW